MTRQRKITDARDDIFLFVNKHFFVDEEVMASITSKDRSVSVCSAPSFLRKMNVTCVNIDFVDS